MTDKDLKLRFIEDRELSRDKEGFPCDESLNMTQSTLRLDLVSQSEIDKGTKWLLLEFWK